MKKLKIATRGSPLALWQSKYIAGLLLESNPDLKIEFLTIRTSGDKFLGSLSLAGGKGLFVKEIEECLLNKGADLAVHSMKDLPHVGPSGLEIACILKRGDPGDSLVTSDGKNIFDLEPRSLIGTSSLRRKAQLLAVRSDLNCKDLRGNVGTRLLKLQKEEFSALILATSGLKRLGLMKESYFKFDTNMMLPAVGQGAIGIQIRSENNFLRGLVKPLICADTTASVKAERKMVQLLGGDCGSPIAGFARLSEREFTLDGLVSDLRGTKILRSTYKGNLKEPEILGERVANDLLVKGARSLLGSE